VGLNLPQTVVFTQGGNAQNIQQVSYFTGAVSFAGCQAPCVYQNAANKTLVMSLPNVASYTIDIYYPQFGGSNPGNGPPGPIPPPGSGPPSPPGNGGCPGCGIIGGGGNITKNIPPPVLALVVGIVVVTIAFAIFLGATNERGGFRKPRSGSPKPRKPSGGGSHPRKPSQRKPNYRRP
jgi:hypothetical protein